MKSLVIILLLSTNEIDIEKIKLQHTGNCDGIANAWREVNTTYHGTWNTDPKQQGNYTPDGKLLIGHICE